MKSNRRKRCKSRVWAVKAGCTCNLTFYALVTSHLMEAQILCKSPILELVKIYIGEYTLFSFQQILYSLFNKYFILLSSRLNKYFIIFSINTDLLFKQYFFYFYQCPNKQLYNHFCWLRLVFDFMWFPSLLFSFGCWDSCHVSNLRRPLPLQPTLQWASNDKNNKVFRMTLLGWRCLHFCNWYLG